MNKLRINKTLITQNNDIIYNVSIRKGMIIGIISGNFSYNKWDLYGTPKDSGKLHIKEAYKDNFIILESNIFSRYEVAKDGPSGLLTFVKAFMSLSDAENFAKDLNNKTRNLIFSYRWESNGFIFEQIAKWSRRFEKCIFGCNEKWDDWFRCTDKFDNSFDFVISNEARTGGTCGGNKTMTTIYSPIKDFFPNFPDWDDVKFIDGINDGFKWGIGEDGHECFRLK